MPDSTRRGERLDFFYTRMFNEYFLFILKTSQPFSTNNNFWLPVYRRQMQKQPESGIFGSKRCRFRIFYPSVRSASMLYRYEFEFTWDKLVKTYRALFLIRKTQILLLLVHRHVVLAINIKAISSRITFILIQIYRWQSQKNQQSGFFRREKFVFIFFHL